jgi:hypothetical protein
VKRLALLGAAVALAGCGGGSAERRPPAPPRLPLALAQTWARQADAVAAALAAGDGCTARRLAVALRADVSRATAKTPRRLLVPLAAAVDPLPSRIGCAPRPAAPAATPKPEEHRGKHGHGHGHGHREGGD